MKPCVDWSSETGTEAYSSRRTDIDEPNLYYVYLGSINLVWGCNGCDSLMLNCVDPYNLLFWVPLRKTQNIELATTALSLAASPAIAEAAFER